MTTLGRLDAAISAIDHGHDPDERDGADWRAVAIVYALIAVAEAIDYETGRSES